MPEVAAQHRQADCRTLEEWIALGLTLDAEAFKVIMEQETIPGDELIWMETVTTIANGTFAKIWSAVMIQAIQEKGKHRLIRDVRFPEAKGIPWIPEARALCCEDDKSRFDVIFSLDQNLKVEQQFRNIVSTSNNKPGVRTPDQETRFCIAKSVAAARVKLKREQFILAISTTKKSSAAESLETLRKNAEWFETFISQLEQRTT